MAATIQTIEKPTRARALDTSGNNNHGQIYSGRALEFDGVSDTLSFDPTKELNNVTVACWVNCNLTGNWNTILGHNHGFGDYIWFHIHNTGYIAAQLNKSSTISYGDLQAANVIKANTWYRAVLTYDSSLGAKIYLNGVEVESESTTGALDNDTGAMQIGSNGSGYTYPFDGKMSDFQYWNATWTAADALYDYNNPEQLALNKGGTSLTNSNLKIWYPMNDGHRGQQSYILDASNTGLGDELLTTTDLTTIGNQAITAGTTLNGWTHHATYQYDSVTASSDGIRIISNGSNDLGSAYQSFHTNPFVITAGKTYRLEYSFTVHSGAFALNVMNNPVGSSAGITRNGITGTENNTVKYFTASSNADASNYIEIYSSATNAFDATISYVSLKPVNDKNHATTVFHGDELITNGTMEADSNWADYNSVNANVRSTTQAHSGTYSRKFTVDGSSQGIQSDTFTTVTGRTYLLSFEIYPDDATTARIAIRRGDNSDWADDTAFSGLTQDAWNTKTVTYTETAGGSGAYLVIHGHGNTSGDFYVDDVSIKEVGTASGWTDADQQLDIPQTALQSYNQFAWFDGYASDTAATLDSQILWEVGQTINMWVYPNVLNQYDSIFGDRNTRDYIRTGRASGAYSTNDEIFQFEMHDNLTSVDGNDMRIKADGAGTLEVGKWLMWTFIWNADRTVDWYENGQKKGDSPATADTTDGKKMEVKYFGAGYGTSALPFEGAMTEISHYTDILTQSEIDDLYNDSKAKSALEASGSGGLSLYLRNNGLSEWKDLKGSNDANVDSTETMLITAGADATRDSQGFLMNRQRATNSLNFYDDGGAATSTIGAQVEVTGNPLTESQLEAMTVTCWFKHPDYTETDALLNLTIDGAAQFIVETNANGRFRWTYEISGFSGSARHKTDNSVFSSDKWTFVAFALDHDIGVDANRVKCYAGDNDNAVALKSIDTTQTGTPTSGMEDNSMWIGGAKASGKKFTGEIDDICVYSKTLTLAEITRNFNAGKRSHR